MCWYYKICLIGHKEKRSASERLAIANAEEAVEKLTLAAEAGIVPRPS